jgi:hypothetical protein
MVMGGTVGGFVGFVEFVHASGALVLGLAHQEPHDGSHDEWAEDQCKAESGGKRAGTAAGEQHDGDEHRGTAEDHVLAVLHG